MQSLFSSGLNQPPRVTKARLITPSVRGSHPVRSFSLVADLFPVGKSLPIWIFTIPQRNYGNIFCFRRVMRGGSKSHRHADIDREVEAHLTRECTKGHESHLSPKPIQNGTSHTCMEGRERLFLIYPTPQKECRDIFCLGLSVGAYPDRSLSVI